MNGLVLPKMTSRLFCDSDRYRHQRKGISLVEMLVATAIIVILVSLVFGSVQGSLEKAGEAKCVGNLRTIGNAFFTYAAENNGTLPQAFIGTSPEPPERDWYGYLAPYAGLPDGGFIGKTGLACPTKSSFGYPFSMYGVNYVTAIGLNPGQSGAFWLDTGVKRLNGTLDGGTFLLADAQGGFVYPPLIWSLMRDEDGDGINDSHPNWPYNGLDFRHGGTANFFLLNGSIVRLTTAQWGKNKDNVWGEPR